MSFCGQRARVVLFVGLAFAVPAAPRAFAFDMPVKDTAEELAADKTQRAQLEKSLAADPKNKVLRLQLGKVLCDLGANGDESASDAAVQLLATLTKDFPKDAVVLAYYGNACSIYAQFASIFTQLSWVHDGFNHLDDAVKAAPENIEVRIARALNSAQVPDFLDRQKTAQEDFAWLLKRIQTNPKDFSADNLRLIYFYDGIFALSQNDAKAIDLFTQAAAIPPPVGDTLTSHIDSSLKTARAKFPPAQVSKTP
jgi:hypothetical protein